MPNEHTIAENLQRLVDAKTAIGNAITAKGGTVGANDGLEEFAAAIAGIPTSEYEIIEGIASNAQAVNDYEVFLMRTNNYAYFFGVVQPASASPNTKFLFERSKAQFLEGKNAYMVTPAFADQSSASYQSYISASYDSTTGKTGIKYAQSYSAKLYKRFFIAVFELT